MRTQRLRNGKRDTYILLLFEATFKKERPKTRFIKNGLPM